MELPRPVLPSQRYSPNTSTADYYDRRQQVSGPRQPLRESSGNAQPQHLGALTLCSQNLSALTSLPHSIPTPPIVPTQSLDSHYGPGSNLKLRRHQLHLQRRQRHGINPIYLSPQFQAYRKKQAEKDYKTAQIWPDFLEDAFLDALLLIPQMGRRKYTMRGQQHGRNMLISEYLWVAYCISLPPGEKPSKLMRRERKQVSSHIQVLKNFFIHHRCYHFFFPGKEKKDDRRDSIETESFKDNPVLRALSEGRLPDERPNYEYFAQLLASDALVTVRPSLCWILVSNNSVEVEMDGPLRGTGFAPSGEKLNPKLYPHLGLNLKREEWPERGKIIRGTLLQEYARTLSQKEASSVKELSQDWEENFPDLYTPLEEVVQNNLRDILHFHVTLDVQEPDQFPEGSELNSLVEITIEQPALQNHTWKAVTRLARPWQLTRDEKTDPPVVEVTREMGVQYVHRQGCENHARCDCSVTARLRRQQLAVPFPAPEWATMLSHLATFAKHPQVNKSKVKVEYDEKGNRTHASKEPTQMDLVKKIAMFQELWSCPPGSGQWTRRAVILWTFETMHGLDDKGKIINNSVGTTWRFLTAIDPTSQYHQQHALVSGSSQPPVNRDAIMSPGPGYQQHLTAAMNENFGSAWDQQSPLGMPSGHHGSVPYGPGAISILDSLPHGLATPPPSASFHSTYANGLSAAHQHDMNGHLSFMSNPAMDTKSTMMSAPDSLYATAGGVSVYDESPVDCDPSSSFQGWDANSMPAMDTRLQPSWTTNFDFSSQGPPQHGNPSHMWNHGLAPSDAKPNVSSSHWAATVASADDKGDAAAWNGQPQSWMQTVAAGDGSGAAPPTWDDSMPPPSSDATAPQGVPAAGTGAGAPQFHRSHSNQGVRNQLSRSATTGSLAGPRAGQKRGRSDSLDERDEYPLASMPKLSHHVSVANAKYAAAVSAAGTPAPPQGVVDGGADQAGSGGEPW